MIRKVEKSCSYPLENTYSSLNFCCFSPYILCAIHTKLCLQTIPSLLSAFRAFINSLIIQQIFIEPSPPARHSYSYILEMCPGPKIDKTSSLMDLALQYVVVVCCTGSSLLCVGFLQLQRAGATLCCGARASLHCGGFSCCGAWALGTQASVVAACGLRSCGTWAQLLRGMWDLPGPGIEPMSPALAGGFLTTVPPGKSLHSS